jgi:hypothetical protein
MTSAKFSRRNFSEELAVNFLLLQPEAKIISPSINSFFIFTFLLKCTTFAAPALPFTKI